MVLHALRGHHTLQALSTQGTPTLLVHLPNSLGSSVPWRVVSWDPPYVETVCSGLGAYRLCPYVPCAPAHQPQLACVLEGCFLPGNREPALAWANQ